MVSAVHLRFNASDRSYFAIIKKEIHALAVKAGFTAKRIGEIDIIISEMVSNLSKHAVDGELFVKPVEEEGIQGMEIISIDNGPGINDVPRMMADGMSTTNTLGHGLGAIRRLSDKFQVYSRKDWGTVLYCTVYNEALPSFTKPKKIEIRSLIVPKTGETDCGDGFYAKVSKDHIKLFLGDGLGHGKDAQVAVQAAIEAFRSCPENSPRETLRFMHAAVKKTRGLVGTVVIFDLQERKWSICGVGNIFSRLQGASVSKNYVAHNGIIGLNIPNTMRDEEVAYERGQTVIMCSDGIKTRWDLLRYPGIFRCDLAFVGAALFKDFARNTDDMAIAACKINV
ncbi:SpoIIE family protein phosphatase [Chitinophaga agrisoli]|uniref:SpoIIE family protein phosphatase n=1 Tax=Chitinophaga agrisoli TaxID=2607653 RepID=A0A5B2VQB0_9BACT|nr:SpoIIE family protein phosphatase [Chitinophaga agrisoli]KAA2241341.1 SpoIIE family protein phosphatase [Chitinophaga agrisoli]